MIKFNEEEENPKEDYFTTEHVDRPREEKKPKEPALTPDDPRYWEQPESEWEHLRPRPNNRIWWWIAAAGIVVGLLIGAYIRYFTPYVDQATQYGYVESIQRRGTLFQTYEGILLPYKELMDTTRVYKHDFIFSTADGALAVKLKKMEYANLPVRVQYKKYRTTMPWRGESKIVITAVDSVDPSKILPPEYNPDFGVGDVVNGN